MCYRRLWNTCWDYMARKIKVKKQFLDTLKATLSHPLLQTNPRQVQVIWWWFRHLVCHHTVGVSVGSMGSWNLDANLICSGAWSAALAVAASVHRPGAAQVEDDVKSAPPTKSAANHANLLPDSAPAVDTFGQPEHIRDRIMSMAAAHQGIPFTFQRWFLFVPTHL